MIRAPAAEAPTADISSEKSSMRYGVLADIHGNLHALERVLSEIPLGVVDQYVVAGDLVGYGPHPNECVDRIRELDAVCVVGNHDLIALGQLPEKGVNELARETLRWTRGVLREDVRRYLSDLPRVVELAGGVVVAHGTLTDPTIYVREWPQAAHELAELQNEWPRARALILGHTHRRSAWAASGGRLRISGTPTALPPEPCLLNPGAVGQARAFLPRAQFMVLDLQRGDATFKGLRYDVRACRRALQRAGLPPDAYHRRPAARRAFGRARRWWRETTRSSR